MERISTAQAKAYAHLIYEQVPDFIKRHQAEYIYFLKSRQAVSLQAKQELERLTALKNKNNMEVSNGYKNK